MKSLSLIIYGSAANVQVTEIIGLVAKKYAAFCLMMYYNEFNS